MPAFWPGYKSTAHFSVQPCLSAPGFIRPWFSMFRIHFTAFSLCRSILALLKHQPYMYSLTQIFVAITQIDGRTLPLTLSVLFLSVFFLYLLSVILGTSNHLLTDMSASRSFSRGFYSAAFVRPVTVATHCCPCFPLNRGE